MSYMLRREPRPAVGSKPLMATQVPIPADPASADPADLALVGEIAALVDARQLWDTLDRILLRVKDYSCADAAELYLADPRREEMFLVSHAGPDADAFGVRNRFRAGEGFPGITLRSGACIVTSALALEADFLRARVKALQYRSVIAVPICHDATVSGCVLLAWKSGGADLDRAVRLTALAARPVAAAVELARARVRLRELELRSSLARPQRPESSDASDTANAIEPRSAPFTFSVRSDRREAAFPAPRGGPDICPACRTGRVQVLGGRAGWPCGCIHCGCTDKARYCIPLSHSGRLWGVATMAFRGRTPAPLTRDLPLALWMAEDLAPAGETGYTQTALLRPTVTARVVVHCLGRFAVTVAGRSVSEGALGRTKAWELLAMLVAAEGHFRSGAHLAAALWPGAPVARARNRFHVTLSALRRVLEPPGVRRWSHVRQHRGSYFLDAGSSLFVDLWHVRQLLRHSNGTRTMSPEREVALLEEALALHDGDLFDGRFAGAWLDGLIRSYHGSVASARDRVAELRLVHRVSAGRPDSPRAMLRTSPAKAMVHAASAT